MELFIGVIVILLIGLALPPALRERSSKRYLIAMIVSMVGIVVPLFFFVASVFLAPEWTGRLPYGWLHCFHLGKLALTPLVIWALAAFYQVQIMRTSEPQRPWVELGIFTGAVVSGLCLVIGTLITVTKIEGGAQAGLLVPLYVTIWFSALFVRLRRESTVSRRSLVFTLLGSVPFWVTSFYWSRRYYLSLPDTPPDCFVVGAALGGHEYVVGPLFDLELGGVVRRANRQLITFWEFEALWQTALPASHRAFRRIYNRLGPHVAKHVRTPVVADFVYLSLKPVEWIARAVISNRPAL